MAFPSLYDAWPGLVATALSALVVLYGSPRLPGFRAWVDRTIRGTIAPRIDWRTLTIVIGVIFIVAAVVQSHPVLGCPNTDDDTGGFFSQGRALLTGGNPFEISRCGILIPVPIGLAGILLNALGSLAGRPGIWLVWVFFSVLLIPLTWSLAGERRRYATVYLSTSVLFVPLVTGQIEGANSAFGAVAVLLPIWLAARGKAGSGALAGFLSTMKFPSLFPFLGATGGFGSGRDREMILTWVAFIGGSLVAWLVWGPTFLSTVFTMQLGRHDISVNEFGVLIPTGWFPPSEVLAALQGVALLGSIAFVYLRRWPALPAAALVTVVVCLIIPRLPFNFLAWLLPLTILGSVYCRWLFAIGTVGALNASIGIPLCNSVMPVCWPSQILGGVLGVFLAIVVVVLLVEHRRDFRTECPADTVQFHLT